MTDFSLLTDFELSERATELGLDTAGSRSTLITRIKQSLEKVATKNSTDSTNQKKKNKRRRKRKQGNSSTNSLTNGVVPVDEPMDDLDVEIEYVPETLENDPNFKDFANVFAKFNPDAVPEVEHIVEPMEQEQVETTSDQEESEEDEKPEQPLSKKKQKKMSRLSIAELKQAVKKPDVVEWVDVTASDPKLLVHLKSCRNTVPVPVHWSQKKKYLQGKRGVEKMPFELPEFIKETGIMEMRNAMQESDDAAGLKGRLKQKMRPKMGRLDIDYQKLHDAFFRFQTKPKMSTYGDMYYEGKEFEANVKKKRPGHLSDELKAALNIPPLAPPPWLINMQRYGPPPSYPQLKIPGLNAPIPEGAQWGFHPGGWGKPPVDELNRPLYGDVFGLAARAMGQQSSYVDPEEKKLWGELESDVEEEEEEEEVEEEEEEEQEEEQEPMEEEQETVVPVTEIEQEPQMISLRKETRKEDQGPKELYTILPQKETSIRGFMGSQHLYDVAGSKPKPGQVEVALNPEELEAGLDSEAVKRKYQATLDSERPPVEAKEDLSDMVREHETKMAQKRQKKDERKDSKRHKEYKF